MRLFCFQEKVGEIENKGMLSGKHLFVESRKQLSIKTYSSLRLSLSESFFVRMPCAPDAQGGWREYWSPSLPLTRKIPLLDLFSSR